MKFPPKNRKSTDTGADKCLLKLQSAFYFAASETPGAYVHVTYCSVYTYANPLRIRQQNTIRLPVGVADIMSGHCALAANFANLSHGHTSFWCVKHQRA